MHVHYIECTTCTVMHVYRSTDGWPITVCGFRSIYTSNCRQATATSVSAVSG